MTHECVQNDTNVSVLRDVQLLIDSVAISNLAIESKQIPADLRAEKPQTTYSVKRVAHCVILFWRQWETSFFL